MLVPITLLFVSCYLLLAIFYFISDDFYLKLAITCKNLFPFAPVVRLVIFFQKLSPIIFKTLPNYCICQADSEKVYNLGSVHPKCTVHAVYPIPLGKKVHCNSKHRQQKVHFLQNGTCFQGMFSVLRM